MAEVARITPMEANEKVSAGKALLICAYESKTDFEFMRLEGAISIQEFRKKRSTLPLETELIFYCAWEKEESSAGQAAKNIKLGFLNSKALLGGVKAWIEQGYGIVVGGKVVKLSPAHFHAHKNEPQN